MCLLTEEGILINHNNEKEDSNKNYLYMIANNWVNIKPNKYIDSITKGKEELK